MEGQQEYSPQEVQIASQQEELVQAQETIAFLRRRVVTLNIEVRRRDARLVVLEEELNKLKELLPQDGPSSEPQDSGNWEDD